MLYRHRLDLEHEIRRHPTHLTRKLSRLLFTLKHVLLPHLATKPLLALPHHLLRHDATSAFLNPTTTKAPD